MTDTVQMTAHRSLETIEVAAAAAEHDAAMIVGELHKPERDLRSAAFLAPEGDADYLRRIHDAHIPALEDAEKRAIAALDRLIDELRSDERTLSGVAFRHSLTYSEQQQLSSALAIARTQLETLSADQLEATIRAAMLAEDRPVLAAFVSLAGILDTREMGKRFALDQALAEARGLIADRRTQQVAERVRAARQAVEARRYRLVDRSNTLRPGSAGGILERYQYGAQIVPELSRDALLDRTR